MRGNGRIHARSAKQGRFFLAVCALNLVQDLVTLVDSWSTLLLASEARRVLEVADDAPILEMQLGREIKLDGHTAENVKAVTVVPESDGDQPSWLPKANAAPLQIPDGKPALAVL